MAAKGNQKNKNRYRIIRSAVVSMSLLSFIPVFGLIRGGASASSVAAAANSTYAYSQPSTSYNGSGVTSASSSTTSAKSSTTSSQVQAHTRTKAS